MLKAAAAFLLAYGVLSSPIEFEKRSCPPIHIFGARETTAPAGYGTSATVVNLVIGAHSGATSEAINYPACGGQASCGGASYASSAQQGVAAVVSAVNNFNSQCPESPIVLVGYSQGGQIMDDALCGGGDPDEGISSTAVPLSASAVNMIAAAIFMGDPRFVAGLSYEVGTCKAGGFAARNAGFSCPSGSKVQSYCDAADPYCCNGNDANTHQGYGTEYGQAALTFVNSKLSNIGTGTGPGTGTGSGTVAKWGQCGGTGYSGPTTCVAGTTCTYASAWYSQCL